MQLTDTETNLLSQALVIAAEKYVSLAADVERETPGGRLQNQFLRQAKDVRELAIMFGDCNSATVDVGFRPEIKKEAGKITNQQFTDEIKSRLGRQVVA